MQTAGLWMLAAVALLMILTGLPAWMVLVGVAGCSAAIGLAAGVFALPVLSALPTRLTGLLENDLLQALPLYVLMGTLLNRLPLADILFRVGSFLLRRTGAGAPLAGIGIGVLLAPMNGSVGASVSMLASAVQPRLDASGVPAERGAAIVVVASTLGVVVPPSLVLILLGDALLTAHTEAVNATHAAVRIINTQDVFLGALLPAAVLLAACLVMVWLANRRAAGTTGAASAPSRSDWLIGAGTALFIGGLLASVTFGYLYAVEGAATGAAALFAFGVATRTLDLARLREILRETMAVTGALLALLMGATVFTLILRLFETDRWIAAFLAGLGGGPYAALAVVLPMLGLCAFVLDAFELIFVVIPILMPPLLMRVPDATWVAALTLLILQASFLLPPFGYAVIMVQNRLARRLSMRKLARALLPYLVAQLCVLALVLAFPKLVWHRDPPQAAAPRTLSDDEVRDLLNQQTGGVEDADGAGEPAGAPAPAK